MRKGGYRSDVSAVTRKTLPSLALPLPFPCPHLASPVRAQPPYPPGWVGKGRGDAPSA